MGRRIPRLTGPGSGYAAGLINLKRKGRTNQFGWLQALATENFLDPHGFKSPSAFAPLSQPVRYARRVAPIGMRLFTTYIHWEAGKGTIIPGWRPQAMVRYTLGWRKTFASRLTLSRGRYGRLDRMPISKTKNVWRMPSA